MKFNNRNVHISPKTRIGNNVKIGDNTSIYDNVVIGDNSIICDNCALGEPLASYYKDIDNYKNPETIIGENALIRSYSIIYAGSTFGSYLMTGNNVLIQAGTITGHHVMIGTQNGIQGNCKIGNYTRLVYGNIIGEKSEIGNYVYMAVNCVLVTDPQPPSYNIFAPKIGDFSVLTTSCIAMPGIEIGMHCLVAPNTTVTKNLEDYSFAAGIPARRLMDIREIPSWANPPIKYYPWPYNFDRNMPWEGVGFEKWQKMQEQN